MKSLLILAPYPKGTAPSQRFRFEQYLSTLEKEYEVEMVSFLDDKSWEILYQPGKTMLKARKMIHCIMKRFLLLPKIAKCDHLFIHREVTQIGPPILEWIIAKVLKKKFVYDFDDSIWLPNYSDTNATFQRVKAYWKVRFIMKWADQITAGNQYLADFAKQYNEKVIVIPTTIDTEYHVPSTEENNSKLTIGWTGSHTTMNYLQIVDHVLMDLKSKYDFEFVVISNQEPEIKCPFRFVKWNKESEIEDLSTFDIGLMPLIETKWTAGKCGFKALQYMALGLPTLASAVGVNKQIIDHEESGYLISKEEDWKTYLTELINNPEKRIEIGEKAKVKIEKSYSVHSQEKVYQSLFN